MFKIEVQKGATPFGTTTCVEGFGDVSVPRVKINMADYKQPTGDYNLTLPTGTMDIPYSCETSLDIGTTVLITDLYHSPNNGYEAKVVSVGGKFIDAMTLQ